MRVLNAIFKEKNMARGKQGKTIKTRAIRKPRFKRYADRLTKSKGLYSIHNDAQEIFEGLLKHLINNISHHILLKVGKGKTLTHATATRAFVAYVDMCHGSDEIIQEALEKGRFAMNLLRE
jgi:hypothetical protein